MNKEKKKKLPVGCQVVVIAVFAIILIAWLMVELEGPSSLEENVLNGDSTYAAALPDLIPRDFCLSLEEIGFSETKVRCIDKIGCEWVNTLRGNGNVWEITTRSNNKEYVNRITGVVKLTNAFSCKDVDFFELMSQLVNNKNEKVAKWLLQHKCDDYAMTVINKISYSVSNTTEKYTSVTIRALSPSELKWRLKEQAKTTNP